jgi:hypothetical protein
MLAEYVLQITKAYPIHTVHVLAHAKNLPTFVLAAQFVFVRARITLLGSKGRKMWIGGRKSACQLAHLKYQI